MAIKSEKEKGRAKRSDIRSKKLYPAMAHLSPAFLQNNAGCGEGVAVWKMQAGISVIWSYSDVGENGATQGRH